MPTSSTVWWSSTSVSPRGLERQVEQAVRGDMGQHVIEEGHAALDVVPPLAVQVERSSICVSLVSRRIVACRGLIVSLLTALACCLRVGCQPLRLGDAHRGGDDALDLGLVQRHEADDLDIIQDVLRRGITRRAAGGHDVARPDDIVAQHLA